MKKDSSAKGDGLPDSAPFKSDKKNTPRILQNRQTGIKIAAPRPRSIHAQERKRSIRPLRAGGQPGPQRDNVPSQGPNSGSRQPYSLFELALTALKRSLQGAAAVSALRDLGLEVISIKQGKNGSVWLEIKAKEEPGCQKKCK